jgi:hypothetical protein
MMDKGITRAQMANIANRNVEHLQIKSPVDSATASASPTNDRARRKSKKLVGLQLVPVL